VRRIVALNHKQEPPVESYERPSLPTNSIFELSLLISIALFLLLFSPSVAVDSIAVNQVIKDGETVVSAGEMYEMGFFSPANSNNRYLGIWYKKIATGTVVWVANGDLPLSNTSGTFKVTNEGLLQISCCGDTIIWSSTSSALVRYINPVAQLLDTGNFVVRDGNSTDETNFIWQSFDYPGDILLPGMKLGKDFVTGISRNLTSWKSPNDPSIGQYLIYVDTNGYPQVFILGQGLVTRIIRFGPWNGVRFSGLPDENPNPVYSVDFVVTQKEVYYISELKTSTVQMIRLMSDGSVVILRWNNQSQDWFIFANGLLDMCNAYGLCGPYGTCNINKTPPCSCMDGSEPKRPDEWNMGDWSSGCQLKVPLDCQVPEDFRKIRGMKFPDTRKSWYNQSMTLGECEMACRKNCSCTAYANIDIRRGGSGCILWFGELMDLKVCEESQDLYIRMPVSLLRDDGLTVSESDTNKMIRVLTITFSISLVLLGLSLAAYVRNKRKKRSSTKGRGRRVHALDKKYSNVENDDLDLNFISLSKVVKATNNFSIDNKLGQGGFGPVYKGYEEFYNEVVCVARLQHRNLVKLLGYCMDGDERILIYEYLANKSLDLYLFGSTFSSCFYCVFGYISPEYAIHGRISVKSDVFSFGVLVLEMVSGKKNRGFSHENVGDNLLGHAWRLYREGKSLELMSPCLRDSCIVSEVERTIHVGLLCVQNLAEDRPTMSSVVMMLDDEGALPPPKEPAFFVGEGLPNSTPFLAGVDEATITRKVGGYIPGTTSRRYDSLNVCLSSEIVKIREIFEFAYVLFVDSIAANQVIKDGETIVSAGEMYEMGFFSPANSRNRYLGIWYKKVATGTVVWVANRELPLSNRSGTFKVNSQGRLLISCCGDTVIWSSTSSAFVRYINPVAKLLDTGNFVVKDGNSTDETNFIWQSFDYPGDTLLPGMKLGKDFVTGTNRNLTSWKSPNDPSLGQYVNYVDTNGYPQVFILGQGLLKRIRYGPWNGIRFSGLPNEMPNPIYSVDFVVNQKEVYYKSELKSSTVQMMRLMWDGSMVILRWNNRSGEWIVFANSLLDMCNGYGLCGPYGSCDISKTPSCTCMDGFEPKRPDEWNMAGWSSGCQRKVPLDCDVTEDFWKIKGMKFPDTQKSWYNKSMTLGECEMACRKNCSCTAYANLDIRRGGSGCLLWFGELLDFKLNFLHFVDDGLTISQSGIKMIRVLTITLSILLVLLGLSLAVYVYKKKRRRSHTKGRGRRVHALDKKYSDVEKDDLDLNFISLSKIVKATNNFSIDNKLGEGGFGPVYKGYDEFYNEVVCVARLQHRNLVKLLGYCMDEDERILIYEYLPNKSLDLYLFGSTLSLCFYCALNSNAIQAWRLYREGKCPELMSPCLRNSCIVSEVERTIHVGLLCVQNLAPDRPTMSSVVRMLSSDGALPPPKQPAFFVGESSSNPKPSSGGVDRATITVLEAR
ncbi:Apple-like protein, partial [Cynara cardunculus var. scolymus]